MDIRTRLNCETRVILTLRKFILPSYKILFQCRIVDIKTQCLNLKAKTIYLYIFCT